MTDIAAADPNPIDDDEELLELDAAGLIQMFEVDSRLTWKRKLSELIDNALDAGARTFDFTRNGDVAIIKDDGIGCPNLKVMASFGKSKGHGRGPRAGRFGLGGKASCIRASKAGLVNIVSVHEGRCYMINVDWAEMKRRDRFFTKRQTSRPATAYERQGTTITINTCRPMPRPDERAAELGYLYMDTLAAGFRIILKADGTRFDVRPYQPPAAKDRVDFAFTWRGMRIAGFCLLVEDGEPNPYPGWSLHWGPHRILGCYDEPAGDRSSSRLQGHVYIPEDCTVNMTKDGFSESIEDLHDLIAEHCRDLIDAADRMTEDYEVEKFTLEVEDEVHEQMIEMEDRIKGRRGGPRAKSGTVEPTGNGAPHSQFAKSQPGDKGSGRSEGPQAKRRFRLKWDDTLGETPWRVGLIGRHGRLIAKITLNGRHPGISHYRQSRDKKGLVSYCHLLIAIHMTSRQNDPQMVIPGYDEFTIERAFNDLSGHITAAEESDLLAAIP